MGLLFEWDSRKARSNKKKHGITFEEDRFVTVGTSVNERLIVVVHTEHNDFIRIISARKATRHERKQYEQA